MATKLLRISNFIVPSKRVTSIINPQLRRNFTNSAAWMVSIDKGFMQAINQAEANLTQSADPVKGGPYAVAVKHFGQPLTSQILHDITMGERQITGKDTPVQSGPTAIAQHVLTTGTLPSSESHTGQLDGATISKVTEKEKELTGQDDPVKGGPTAKAQQHAGEPINSQALHDITEGEKMVTGGERVKGGPTATAQSELAKSRA